MVSDECGCFQQGGFDEFDESDTVGRPARGRRDGRGGGSFAAVASAQGTATLDVTGLMVDQACLSGDRVSVQLTARARSSSRPVTYRWDFTNDGVFDTAASTNPSATATYPDEVNATALVEATNGAGEVATDTVTYGTLRCVS